MRMIGMPGVLRQVAKLDALRLSEEARKRLAVLLRQRGFAVSESTVGRILSYLMRRGEVQPSPVLLGRKSARARRSRRCSRRCRFGCAACKWTVARSSWATQSIAPGQMHTLHFSQWLQKGEPTQSHDALTGG